MGPEIITLLAFNVLYDSKEIDASIDLIENAKPDVVCLTELTPAFAKRFEERLGETYPHRKLAAKSGTWGVGIASRFPLHDTAVFEQKPHRIPAMQARVKSERGTSVLVACLHLFPPLGLHKKSDGILSTLEKNATLRRQQAESLIARYQNEHGPTVLAGDLNEGPREAAVQAFGAAGYARACERAPSKECGGTWPGSTSAFPATFEIDHILGRCVSFTKARVIHGGGSDHFPVWAELALDSCE